MKQYDSYLINNNLDVFEVTKDNVERFLLQCSSVQLRKKRLSLVKKFYDYLKRKGVALLNPAVRIKILPKITIRVPKVPGKTKVNRLVENISSVKRIILIRNQLMVELAYGSGLRRCELHALNIEDININGNTARIKGKGNRYRMVPLTGKTLELLKEYLILRGHTINGHLLLSFNTGRRLTNMGISSAFKNNIGIRPHLLRHACATHMLDNGCDIRFIQELLGHMSLTSTQRYTQVAKMKLMAILNSKHPRNKKNEEKPDKEVSKSL
jgi:integrase/recombinase XerC